MHRSRIAFLVILVVISAALALFYGTVNKTRSRTLPPGDIQEATTRDFYNSVIVKKDHAVVMIEGKASEISFENLGDDFSLYAEKLREKEVVIIGARDGDFKKVVDVLDLMIIYKIPRYKLMRSGLKSEDI